MNNSVAIVSDLDRLGFSFRITGKRLNSIEVMHDNRIFRCYDRNENRLIWAIIRSSLRDIGYTETDLQAVRGAILYHGQP